MHKVIKVTKGTGLGDTKLAAFDHALQIAGISNYNLIPLSSVIPTGYTVEVGKPDKKDNEFGHKLYVVISEKREDEVGKEAWAGVGWMMRKGEDGNEDKSGGLFVEHHGHTEEEVINLIANSLGSMRAKRTDEEYGEIQYEIAGLECVLLPVCALVAAVYKSEGWE